MNLRRMTIPRERWRLWLPLVPLALVWPAVWVLTVVLYLISRERELEEALHGRLRRAAFRARRKGWPVSPSTTALFLLPLALLWPWMLLVLLCAFLALRSWERDAAERDGDGSSSDSVESCATS